jgi:hypothetical protein
MKKKVNTMLEDDTIELLTKEAKEKSISISAVIRQKVEASYKIDPKLGLQTIKGEDLVIMVNSGKRRS